MAATGQRSEGCAKMEFVVRELRFAGRLLIRTPGFALVSILTLGVTIGACTIIYSIVDGIVLRPLPYPHPERIVRLSQIGQTGQREPFSDLNFEDLQAQAVSFEAMAEYSPGTTSVTAGTLPVRSGVSTVSHSFFDVMATYPSRGRLFVPEELREGGVQAAIVSHRFWQEHFGDLENLAEARLRVNGVPYTVVGVIYRIRNGKIAESWGEIDFLRLIRELRRP
jgi:putative ABC transport system permease protein